jgi:RHS repeat-associated protein
MSICNVNIGTGDVYHHAEDFFLRGGFIPLRFVRDYESGRKENSTVGQRWRHNLIHKLVLREKRAFYVTPDGNESEIPHPDFPRAEDAQSDLKTRREKEAILLSDLGDWVYRFEPFKPGDNTLVIRSQIDPRGNHLDYKYSREEFLEAIRDTRGRIVVFTSNERGYIAKISVYHPEEPNSRRDLVHFEYDNLGNLRSVRDRNDGINRFTYQGHLLVEHINALEGKTYFKYDSKGRCVHTHREDGTHERKLIWHDDKHAVEVRDSRGAVWNYVLNDQKRPLVETDPLGRKKEYFYDAEGNLQFTKDEHASQAVTLFFDDQRLLISQTGSLTSMVRYDEKMRVIETVNAAGAKRTFKYDERSNRVEMTDPMDAVWRFEYERDGWLSGAVTPRGHHFTRKRTSRWEVEYGDEIRLDAVLRYNPLGLLAATVDAHGQTTRFDYEPTDRMTAIHYADGSQVRYQYDAMGNMTRVETESGAATAYEYDPFGAAVAVTNPLGHRGSYRYDSEGNLIEVRNFKGETAAIQYDLIDQIVAVTLFDGRTHRYTHHRGGTVATVRDENDNLLLEIQPDDQGRIAKKIFPGGWEVTYEWGEQSQLLSAKNPHATLRIEYTPNLRVAAEHVNDFSVFYEYDEVGNRKLLRTNTGRLIEYFWDARNRLTRIVDTDRAVYEFSYYEVNLFREWVCPSLVQRYTFDNRLRMTRRVALEPRTGAVLAERTYQYDPQGSLVRMRDQQRGGFQYRYSALEAILEVRGDGGYAETYAWDPNENLTQMRDGSRITYSAGNRLARAGNQLFEHNRDGGVTKITENRRDWLLGYNPEGQLASVRTPDGQTVEYHYDPLGRRIRKILNGQATRFYWDQGAYLGEAMDSGEAIDYLFLPQTFLPLGMTTAAGHFSFVLDQAGTPTEIVDKDGAVVWSGDYSAFGELNAERVRQVRNPVRFQGQYFDEETGFHYNFSRYYYPSCARYLSQDPLGLRAGVNLYRYVMNPFNWVDPFGLNNLVSGVLTIYPICGWSKEQQKAAGKKRDAMNKKLGKKGITLPDEPVQRCGKTAKEIYEDCQQEAKDEGKKPKRDLNETGTKCTNEQADHILEICATNKEAETDCANLQPLNESVNKSYGSQVGHAVRGNPGAALKSVKLAPMSECTERPSVDC